MHFPSSAAPALTVSSPTATTVSFTVSTRAPRTTFPAHILHAMALLLRLAVALSIFGLWWVKWTGFKPWPRQEMDSRDGQYSPVWTDWAMASVYDVVELCRWRWLASAGLVTLFIVVRRGYKGGLNSVIKHYRELRGGDHKHYARIEYQVRRIWDCAIANRVGRRVTCCAARPGHSDHVVLADISGD